MKILRTTATFYPHVTGPAYQAYKISEGLQERGHESPIVTTDVVPEGEEPGYPPEMEENDEFSFKVIRRKPLFSIDQYRLPPQAIYDVFSESPDIIHCHGYHNAIKDMFYLGNIVRSKPFVIHGHDSFSKDSDPTIERSWKFDLYDRLLYRTIEHADAIVVSSEQERKEANSFGIDDGKISVIPAGKDPEVFNSIPRDTPDDVLQILFVGRLAPRRNVELLIRAVAELDRKDVELRIVGGEGTLTTSANRNYTTKLKERVADLGIEDQVVFTGPKYGDGLIREYRSAHLFVNPTHYENFGQANLEAAFAGLPLIATPTGIALDLVDEAETGYLFDDQLMLVDLLANFSADDDDLSRMGKNISEKAEREYTWDSILDQYCKMYDQIAD